MRTSKSKVTLTQYPIWHRLILTLHSMNRAYLYPILLDGEILTNTQALMKFKNLRGTSNKLL